MIWYMYFDYTILNINLFMYDYISAQSAFFNLQCNPDIPYMYWHAVPVPVRFVHTSMHNLDVYNF